jgi:2-phosphosulfolactate phosphatase
MTEQNEQQQTEIEVLFTPADFEALKDRDLGSTTCVVFDVLRATSSMITALSAGAHSIVPVATIAEALEIHRKEPEVLLAGERDGLKITTELTGTVSFDLGNSPREFTTDAVKGRRIVMTTTNGTRALRACIGAERVFVSSLLNLGATAAAVRSAAPRHLLIVCSGTFEEAAYEDVLGAGALCHGLWDVYGAGRVSDSALMALNLYEAVRQDLVGALGEARNGKRLLSRPELAGDVAYCGNRDKLQLTAILDKHGAVTKL